MKHLQGTLSANYIRRECQSIRCSTRHKKIPFLSKVSRYLFVMNSSRGNPCFVNMTSSF